MGTNYYVAKKPGELSQDISDESKFVHIGKKSFGWEFGFRSYKPKVFKAIYSWQDWYQHIKAIGHVFNEYGDRLSVPEFVKIVEGSKNQFTHSITGELITPLNHIDWCIANNNEGMHTSHLDICFKDADGYTFQTTEFF